MSVSVRLYPSVCVRRKNGVAIRFADADDFANWLNDVCSSAAVDGGADVIDPASLEWLEAILKRVEGAISSGAPYIAPEIYEGLTAPADAPVSIRPVVSESRGASARLDQVYLDYAQSLYRMAGQVGPTRQRKGDRPRPARLASAF